MTEDDAQEVFGNLPRRRPGIESPHRARAREAGPRAGAEPPAPAGAPSEQGELEQIARAGAQLAAGAAASGLRIAGRTIGGLGRVVGRL
jgi:hypothetical protein